MSELTSLVKSFKPKIITITETWCKGPISGVEICLLNYMSYTGVIDATLSVMMFCCISMNPCSLYCVLH